MELAFAIVSAARVGSSAALATKVAREMDRREQVVTTALLERESGLRQLVRHEFNPDQVEEKDARGRRHVSVWRWNHGEHVRTSSNCCIGGPLQSWMRVWAIRIGGRRLVVVTVGGSLHEDRIARCRSSA